MLFYTQLFGLSKTLTDLRILFGNIGCYSGRVNSNQIQVELDVQLQDGPGLGYEKVSQICPHCSWTP